MGEDVSDAVWPPDKHQLESRPLNGKTSQVSLSFQVDAFSFYLFLVVVGVFRFAPTQTFSNILTRALAGNTCLEQQTRTFAFSQSAPLENSRRISGVQCLKAALMLRWSHPHQFLHLPKEAALKPTKWWISMANWNSAGFMNCCTYRIPPNTDATVQTTGHKLQVWSQMSLFLNCMPQYSSFARRSMAGHSFGPQAAALAAFHKHTNQIPEFSCTWSPPQWGLKPGKERT